MAVIKLPLPKITKKLIGKARHKNKKEQAALMVVEILRIVDALVYLLSLGFYHSTFASHLLFSEYWLPDD